MAKTPKLPETSGLLQQLVDFLKQKIDEAKAKLPEGATFTTDAQMALIKDAIQQYATLIPAVLYEDLKRIAETGKGPSVHDSSYEA